MKKISITILFLLITQISFSAEFKGLLSLNNVSTGEHKFLKIEVKYRLYTFIGEPCKTFVMKYSPADNAKLNNIKLRARVLCGTRQNAFVSISPMIPKANKWGFDVSGSPNWDNLFFTNNGGAISAERAKQYFKDGFSLVDLEIIEISAEESNPFNEKYDGKFFKVNRSTITDLEKSLPNSFNEWPHKRDKSKAWGNKKIFAKWWRLKSDKFQYNLSPFKSHSNIISETMRWTDNGKKYQAYRIILNSKPQDEKTKKEISEPTRLKVNQKWDYGEEIISNINYSTMMSVGDKIVFVKSCGYKSDTYSHTRSPCLTLEHILPNQEDNNENPFTKPAEENPFFNDYGPENPLAKADRIKGENIRKSSRNQTRREKIAEIHEQRRLRKEFDEEIRKSGLTLGSGDVQITLTWDSRCDVDLYVQEPSGTVLSYNKKSSAIGGRLDVDNTTAYGPENIYWTRGLSPEGTFKVWVVLYSSGSTNYKVKIMRKGRIQIESGSLSGSKDKDIVSTFENDPSEVEITLEQLEVWESQLINSMESHVNPYEDTDVQHPFE